MEKRRIDIPAEFIALNGALQKIKIAFTKDNPQGEYNYDLKTNYLKILDALRSNGCQPVITTMNTENNELEISVEQSWCYGCRNIEEAHDPSLKVNVIDDIEDILMMCGLTKQQFHVDFMDDFGSLKSGD